ncbi:MAG: inorganic phosphate transporter [Chitinivibrionales bacterium]|nr:inorganic phosphate transporter [Chitinivibrionales bacterium]
MVESFYLVIIIVVVALIFDFCNGFNDAANAIATLVVSKTLNPLQAVIMAGCANFAGCFIFGVAVANTIGKNVVQVESVSLVLLLSTLLGAILWDVVTWFLGLPTSSSHALIGGLIGSGVAAAGFKVVVWHGVLKIFSFIFIAPLLGMLGAIFITWLVMVIFRKTVPRETVGFFKVVQIFASLMTSIGHGSNDAQKTMGIIALALYTSGVNDHFEVNRWVVLSAYSAISLGTFFGGWRIVKTMGSDIIKIREMEGSCVNAAASCVLLCTAHAGIPVSTTHVLAGSIMGVGTVKAASKVRWITARKIVYAWIVTIPLTALCSGLCYLILNAIL